MRTLLPMLVLACCALRAAGQDAADQVVVYATETDILYRDGDGLSEYAKQRCRLDVYYPKNQSGFATIVWFHGGGLKGGNRFVPPELKEKSVAVVAVNYRLHPNVKSPTYIEDAAASVAWVFNNIEKFGGDPTKIFVSGHSAGGYLTSMIGLDKRWLARRAMQDRC